MRYRNILIGTRIFLALLCITRASAQDFKKDMLAINHNLFAATHFSLTMHYEMFIDKKQDKPYEQRDVNIVSIGSKLYCEQKDMVEFMANDKYRIIVDHRMKQMMVTAKPREEVKASEVLDFFYAKFDSLQLIFTKVVYKPVGGSVGSYQCSLKSGAYTRMDIYFDKQKMLPVKVVYHYRDPISISALDDKLHPITLAVQYQNFKTGVQVPAGLFAMSRYVSVLSGNAFKAIQKYHDYEIINKYEPIYESK